MPPASSRRAAFITMQWHSSRRSTPAGDSFNLKVREARLIVLPFLY
jgi:hypothetical protein